VLQKNHRFFVIFFCWGSLTHPVIHLLRDSSYCHTTALRKLTAAAVLLREPASFIFCNRYFVQLFNWCSLLCCPKYSQAKAAKTACIETIDGDGCF